MPIASRLLSTGTLLVNGSFDEFTESANATTLTRQTINTILANNFDEVTFNSVNPIIINQFTYSEDFSNVAWQKSGATITSDQAIAPNGTYTADLMSATGLFPRINRPAAYSVTNGQSFTHTIFVKYINQQYCNMVQEVWPGSWSSRFDLINGTYTQSANVTASMSSVGDGWYRCRNTYVVPTGQTSFQPQFRIGSYDGTDYAGSNVYVWGAQLEGGTSATIYQGISAANALVPSTTVKKIDTTGGYYLQGSFDEFTGAPVVDGNLMVWVDAGQTASYPGSGATWTDLSGNGKNYTLTNTPTYNSILGGGVITFAGASSQYATTAATLFNSTTFNTYTMSLWAYPTGAGNFVQVNGQTTPNTAYHYSAIEISAGGTISFGQWIGSMSTIATSVQSFNAWYNLVITYNGTTATAYVNGVSVGSTNIIWSSPGANTFMALMAIDTTNMGTGAYASGSLGAFMVYRRALSADEIATNFNALRGRYGI